MAQRISKDHVARRLEAAGFPEAEWDMEASDWDPGYRLARPPLTMRRLVLRHEGPGRWHHLDAYTGELRAAGYHVHAVGERLEITRP